MWPLRGKDIAQMMGLEAPEAVADTAFEGLVAWAAAVEGPLVVFVIDDSMVPFAAAASRRGAWVIGPPGSAALPGMMVARHTEVEAPLHAFRSFAKAFRQTLPCPVLAVGGSNGKTTTKDLLAAALAPLGKVVCTRGTNNGWAGVPTTLTRHELRRDDPPAALVVEVGIDEVGAMAAHMDVLAPDVAVLTCLGPEHLAGLGDHETCVAEELKLFTAKQRVWLADDPQLRLRLDQARAGDAVVGAAPLPPTAEGVLRVESVVEHAGDTHQRMLLREAPVPGAPSAGTPLRLAMPGAHNQRNAALAFATARLLGANAERVSAHLGACTTPAQRGRITQLGSGCILIDDTYNASPSSVEAALAMLRAYPHREPFVVLGDMLDLGAKSESAHAELIPMLRTLPARSLVLVGPAMGALAGSLANIVHSAHDSAPSAEALGTSLGCRAVLVKGSRGMHMEQTAQSICMHEAQPPPGRQVASVLGHEREAIAARLRQRHGELHISAFGPNGPVPGHTHTFILFDFEPEEDDVEAELARLVAPLLKAKPPCSVFLGSSEAMDLVATVTPRSLTLRRIAPSSLDGFVDEVTRALLLPP